MRLQNEFYSRDSRILDLHQKLYSKGPDKRSNSNQQDTSGSASARNWKQSADILVTEEMKNNPDNSTEESDTSRNRKLMRSHVPDNTHVEEKPEFKIDLRIEVIAHNVILKDEERQAHTRNQFGKI